MKIDYEQIGSRATARSKALQATAAILEKLPNVGMNEVMDFFDALKEANSALDAEGKRMLPEEARDLLDRARRFRDYLEEMGNLLNDFQAAEK